MALATVLLSTGVSADEQGMVMSIPHAISDDHIYKVTIEEINGAPQEPALNYRLAKGAHVIKVRIMLNDFRESGVVNTGKFAGRTFIEIVRKQHVISVTDKPWCQSHTN